MKDMKEIYVDVETTGLNPWKHGVWQIACIVHVDGEEKDRFNKNVAPFLRDIIDPETLVTSGMSSDNLRCIKDSPSSVIEDLKKFLIKFVDPYNKEDKFQFIGYNARFDMDFLRVWFSKGGDRYFGSWFWFPPLDVMGLAAYRLRHLRSSMPNFKQHTVAEKLGIKVDHDKLHDAMYDIELTIQISDVLRDTCNV